MAQCGRQRTLKGKKLPVEKLESPNRHRILIGGIGCEKHDNCFACTMDAGCIPQSWFTGQVAKHRVRTSAIFVYYDGDNYSQARLNET